MFNIPKLPKKHYDSSKTEVLVVQLRTKLLGQIERQAEQLGYSTHELIGLVLDQFIFAMEKRTQLVEHKSVYLIGKSKPVSLRLNKSLIEALKKKKDSLQLKPSMRSLVEFALDYYLSF